MKSGRNFNGHVRQEYIDVILHLIPKKATVNLQSDYDCIHLSLNVNFKNSTELRNFQKAVAPYRSRIA